MADTPTEAIGMPNDEQRAQLAEALRSAPQEPDEPFQGRVGEWMVQCFAPEIIADKLERADRFIEESLELIQATGYSADRAHALVDYTFNRPRGEAFQEVGGVMVTLAALCNPHSLDMDAAAEAELARVWTKIDVIRAKQAVKPVGSALPIPDDDALIQRLEDMRDYCLSEMSRPHPNNVARLCDAVITRLQAKPETPYCGWVELPGDEAPETGNRWRCLNCKEVWHGVEMPDRCGTCCCSSFAKVAPEDRRGMMDTALKLGRFGHHPNPAIDFCVEVEEIQSIAHDRKINFANPDDSKLEDRIFRAMQFNVGGDAGAVSAKALLREIEAQAQP